MADFAFNDDDDGRDDEVDEQFNYQRQTVIFLIEATKTMLQPMSFDHQVKARSGDYQGAPAKSLLELVLRFVYGMMRRKIISSPKTMFAVLIYNTAETTGSDDLTPTNGYYLVPFKQISVEMVLSLKELLAELEHDPTQIEEMFAPHDGPADVGNAFGYCGQLFKQKAPKFANKRIFLVTDNDNPHQGRPKFRETARTKKLDMDALGYEIEPIFLASADGFNPLIFWEEVLANEDGISDLVVPQGDSSAMLNEILNQLRRHETTTRIAFKIPFYLAEEFTIGIKGYNLVSEQKKKKPVKVDPNSEDGEEVIAKKVYLDPTTAEPFDSTTEIKRYFSLGHDDATTNTSSRKIFIAESDLRKIKTCGLTPGLRLLGFMGRDTLNWRHSLKHAHFIYPNEQAVTGSTRTFAAMLQSMLTKDVVGIASLLTRSNSSPVIVVMIPQEEVLTPGGLQLQAPGIHLCQLPFADDLRDHGLTSTTSVIDYTADNLDELPDPPAVTLFKKVVKHLSKPFVPDDYPNPALNYHNDTLAALVFNENVAEVTLDDKTQPNGDLIAERVGKYLAKIREVIDLDERDTSRMEMAKGKNYKLGDAAFKTVDDMRAHLPEIQSGKITVDKIKALLAKLGHGNGGATKKADLLERLIAYLKEKDLWEEAQEEEDDRPRKKRSKKE